MLISHKYKFIYLKTTKTAGTSVEVALQKFALPEGTEVADPLLEPIVTSAGIVGARGGNARQHKWYNHMTAATVKEQVSDDVWNNYLKFCNLRNPWEKTVSWFHFKHRKDIAGLSDEDTVAAFRRAIANTDRPMHDFNIYTIKGRPVADDYVRHNVLEKDLERICKKLGIEIGELPTKKAGLRNNALNYKDYYDEQSREKVARIYSAELDIYGWEFDQLGPKTISV